MIEAMVMDSADVLKKIAKVAMPRESRKWLLETTPTEPRIRTDTSATMQPQVRKMPNAASPQAPSLWKCLGRIRAARLCS